MCIRDSLEQRAQHPGVLLVHLHPLRQQVGGRLVVDLVDQRCLLYTSDAADERSSVDLGGRRIIKKKNIRSKDSSSQISKTYTRHQETSAETTHIE